MNVAIIPARGGSKRIPRKNIKDFCGKPMIAWSIEKAIQSGCFDRVIVSTDDAEIASVAVRCGAEVPFLRPAELADDHTGTIPVIAHAVEWLNANGSMVDKACCIYATSPFLKAEDLIQGLSILDAEDVGYVFSVTSFPFPIQRAIRIRQDKRIEMFEPQNFDMRSQDLEEAWHDAGQFYWGKARSWIDQNPIFNSISAPVLLPRYRVQDIDTNADWIRAEYLFQVLENELNQNK
jgi:N-acylneuraminate cytidylyltransferase